MAIDFNDATPDYLYVNSSPTANVVGTIAVRAKCDDDNPANDQYYFYWGNSGDAGDWFSFSFESDGKLRFWARSADATGGFTVGDYADGAWHDTIATWDGTYDGGGGSEYWLYVGAESIQDTRAAPSVTKIETFNRVAFGMLRDSSPNQPFDGKIADVAIWDVILTAAERAMYFTGYTPDQIRPQNLVSYWPLIRSTNDIRGGLIMTPGGAPVASPHPRIIEEGSTRGVWAIAVEGSASESASESASISESASPSPGPFGVPVYEDNGGIATGSGVASIDVPYPATVNENDILIVTVMDADSDSFNTPAGWTKIDEYTANDNLSVAWFWKRAAGTESGNETFTSLATTGNTIAGIMSRFSNCITSGVPYEDATKGNLIQDTTIDVPTVTATDWDRLACVFAAIEDDVSMDTATGYTERYEITTAVGDGGALVLQDQEVLE